jgi:polar amino acid transport system substrate-binding protein
MAIRFAGRILMSLLFGSALAGSADAADRLRLVTGNDYRPFADQSLPDGGSFTRIVRAVFAQIGQDIEVTFLPWRRGYELSLSGLFDGTFPYLWTIDRNAVYLYSEPVVQVRQWVYSRPGQFQFTGLDSLKGRVICLANGYAVSPDVQAMLDHGLILRQQPAIPLACIDLIRLGRADFFISNEQFGASLLKEANVAGEITTNGPPIAETGLHFIVPRNRPDAIELMATFNGALKQLRDQGSLAKLAADPAP